MLYGRLGLKCGCFRDSRWSLRGMVSHKEKEGPGGAKRLAFLDEASEFMTSVNQLLLGCGVSCVSPF